MAESDFTEIANATSIIFATSTSESAIAKLKISSQGHFLPLLNKTYDIGASGTKFRNVYAENGNFENVTISNLSDPYEILYITDNNGTVGSTDLLKIDTVNGELELNGDIVGTGDINISGTITATSGNFSSLRVNGINVSLSGHTHMASDVINFSEAVDDRVNDLLIEGTGVQLTYNDSGNTLTLNNLHTEINELSLEPQGFVNRLDSIISFNDSTRTFTIQPSGSSYDVYIEGVKFTKTAPETVVIGSGTALNYLHFDVATKQLHNKTTAFNFDIDVPIAYIHWNGDINQSTFFGEERHGIRMDSSTHKWIHNTFGMQYINGLSIGNYVLEGNGTSNSHAQMSISDGTLYQEDIVINIMDGDNGVEFTQQLSPTGYFPVYYHSGITGQWVRDSGTPYPVKYNATRALYNSHSGGTWSVINVPNNRYFAMWLVATNDINDPILSIMGQREDSSLGGAENNNNWTDIDLTNIPANELRPLYRLIFLTNDTFTNTPKSSLYSILDLRRSVLTTTYGVPQNDHGNLFGLGDDDHAQYVHINEARTISANHTFTNGLTINNGLLSATSGNFSQILNVNSSGVFASGLNISNQTSSTIASFDANKNVVSLSTSTYPSLTELSYVKGVTSAIQTQIGTKADTSTTITAGSGLAGGGSLAANRTIDIGQGDGITVSADSIAVDSTVIRTTGVQTMSGAKTFTAATVFSTGVTISSSGTNVPLTITNDGTGNSFVVNDITGDTSPFVINNDGRIGIGLSTPSYPMHIAVGASGTNNILSYWNNTNNTKSRMAFQDTSTTYALDLGSVGNIFTVETVGVERFRIDGSGNIDFRLNSGSISHRFTYNENGGEIILHDDAQNNATLIDQCSNQTRILELINGSDMVVGLGGNNTTGAIKFMRAGFSEAMRIDSSGNIGIGTTTPTFVNNTYAGLHIHAATATSLKLTNTATGQTSTDGFELLQDAAGNAYIWNRENTNISIATSGTSRITITNDGKVGIGVTPASAGSSALQVRGDLDIFGNGSDRSITYNMGVGDDGITGWYRSKIAFIPSSATNKISQHIAFFNKDGDLGGSTLTERMRIATDGNVGIGTSSPQARLHVSSTNDGVQAIFTGAQTANTQSILFRSAYHTNNGTAGFANIGWIDNASQGGHLTFGTTSSNSGTTGTPTERMRITSAGDIGIGTSSVSSGFKVDIRGRVLSYTTASDGLVTVQGLQTASAGTGKSAIQIDVNGNGGFAWQNDASSGTRILKLLENSGYGSGDSELIRVLTGGDVLIGTTTDQGSFKLQVANNAWMDNLYLSTTTNWGRLAIGHNGATTFAAGFNNTDTGSAGQTTVNILRNGTSVGTISTTNAATSYNTNSDYRLKNNVSNMIGASVRLLSLRPVTFEWKVGGSGEGFIAHELAEAVPLAVTGEKDAKDSYGMPIMQSVDHSKLVPLLVSALQEAYAEIANIKSRLSSLEQK
jgi:hypothetical protein